MVIGTVGWCGRDAGMTTIIICIFFLIIFLIMILGVMIMALIDDLGVAVSSLGVSVDAVIAKIDELKGGQVNIDPQLTAAITAVNDAKAKLDGSIA